MKIDVRAIDDRASFEADLCIIGAGAAGITIARELAGLPIKILLIEGGGMAFEPETASLYEGESTGLRYFPLNSCRLRYFGGSTGHWAGWCTKQDPIVFEKRDWIAHSGWPISHADLEPWYPKAQSICELGPYNYDPDYWARASGSTPLPLPADKIGIRIFQFSKPPTRFGTVYRDSVVSAPNITLLNYANVTQIQSNAAASHVKGLEVRTLDGKTHTIKARNYVLACGGIENARLLLLSNKVVSRGLANQNDLVGRYFMEHPHLDTSRIIFSPGTNLDFYQWKDQTMTHPEYLRMQKPFMPMFTMSAAFQRTHRIGEYSSMLKKLGAETPGAEGTGPKAVWGLHARIEQVPNPNSRVTLSATGRDALGQPQVSLHWQLTSQDKATIRHAERQLARSFGQKAIGRMMIPDWVEAEDNEWPAANRGGAHHMGTTRMSESARTGVVDRNCRVHGIGNLYIAGSSVFTTGGAVNPTLTIVALAARLANHLKAA